jgi:hypothetical protein
MERGYSRSRERDERIRAGLAPLAPEERPLALKLSVLLALLIALSNLIALAAGVQVEGKSPVAGGLLFALIMVMAAVGMWQKRYWAVLGFEALLGCLLLWTALSLLVASNLAAALLCLAVFAIAGPLFWLLIRVMARIQAGRQRVR